MVNNLKKLKTEIRKLIEEKYKNAMESLTTEMNDKEKRLVDINSNWSIRLTDSTSNYRIWIRVI